MTLLLFGCVGGFDANAISGQKTTYNGLSFDKTYFSIDEQSITKAVAYSGQKVAISFTGVKGFKENNGTVVVDINISVSLDGNSILEESNLLSAYSDGVTPDQATELNASWTVGQNAQVGKVYVMKMIVWDKNGTGTITSELPITIIENDTTIKPDDLNSIDEDVNAIDVDTNTINTDTNSNGIDSNSGNPSLGDGVQGLGHYYEWVNGNSLDSYEACVKNGALFSNTVYYMDFKNKSSQTIYAYLRAVAGSIEANGIYVEKIGPNAVKRLTAKNYAGCSGPAEALELYDCGVSTISKSDCNSNTLITQGKE